MKQRWVHGLYLILEKILHWCINPYLRAFLLRILGATIGKNVRIYEIKLINLTKGLKNLIVEDDVHIGCDVLIDLTEKVIIRKGATISPRVVILTHSNPGCYHSSPICELYPPRSEQVEIGQYVWVGACSTISLGVKIGDRAVIGACSFVNSDIPSDTLSYGVPAKIVRQNLSNKCRDAIE